LLRRPGRRDLKDERRNAKSVTAMPHANPPSHYHSKILLLLLLPLLMSSDSSLYKTKIRGGVLGLTTGSTKDLTVSIDRAFLGDMPMGGMGRPRAEA
jgi:hypothetical protein